MAFQDVVHIGPETFRGASETQISGDFCALMNFAAFDAFIREIDQHSHRAWLS